MVSLNLSIPLQFDQPNRQDRELAAKLALAEQVRARREEAEREMRAEVLGWLQEWQSNRERLARYDRTLIPLAPSGHAPHWRAIAAAAARWARARGTTHGDRHAHRAPAPGDGNRELVGATRLPDSVRSGRGWRQIARSPAYGDAEHEDRNPRPRPGRCMRARRGRLWPLLSRHAARHGLAGAAPAWCSRRRTEASSPPGPAAKHRPRRRRPRAATSPPASRLATSIRSPAGRSFTTTTRWCRGTSSTSRPSRRSWT